MDERLASATEILRRLLDERGVEYFKHEDGEPLRKLEKADEPATSWHMGGASVCAVPIEGSDLFDLWIDHCTPEQAIAATLGSGKLTAEQVRECTEIVYLEGYSDGSVNRGAHIEETDWQAIADELNVMLGSGECEDVSTKNGIFKCSECGCTVEEDGVDWGYIQFCPDCGRAVKR